MGILVVDDEPSVRELLQVVLQGRGFTVWLADNGQQAVEWYQHSSGVALVLLDVCMPRLDGPQTLEALQRIDPGVRCCFMSAWSGKYSADELVRRGARRVFAKPFRLAELGAALWELAARVEEARTEDCLAGA